jgi:phosphoserine phosphatase RsbU/P
LNSVTIPSKKTCFARLRIGLQIEQVLVFVGVVVYAMLASVNQRPSLGVIMLSILTVGNLVIPFAFLSRRIYVRRPFPWNWVLFFPVQIAFGFLCAFGSILFLRWTRIDHEPFWNLFHQFGYLTIIVVVVANVVMFAVEELQKKLKDKNQQLEQTVEKGTIALQQQEEELKRAREIQQMLLPNTLPQIPGAQIAGAWQPAREVGGDYFDVVQLDEMRFGICVGDVAGKGITAALLMANLQASFRAFATADAAPEAVCTKLNKFLCANIAAGKFVTFLYAVFDAEKKTLTYENAGHNPGLLLRANGELESLSGGGAVLGAFPDWVYQDYRASRRWR